MTANRDELIAAIAREVIARLTATNSQSTTSAAAADETQPGDGIFATVDEAVRAASETAPKIAALSLDDRGKIIAIVRRLCAENAETWARIELAETGLGRLDHKTQKLYNVKYVLGIEALKSSVRTDASGMCLIERAPWGLIGMVLPATHSVPTMASNMINVVAGGNVAIFSPHPAACKVACLALKAFNREIEKTLGIRNAFVSVTKPSIRSAEEVFHHPGIALLCVTGGPAVVRAAAKSGKRVIAAGPGNPPVVVDETADLDNAARSIIAGGAFDNNLLCIGEKEVFVVASVFDAFVSAMKRAGAYELNVAAIDKLTQAAFRFDGEGKGCGQAHLKKELIGKDVSVLAAVAGVTVPAKTELLFGQTAEDHPFVQEEQMMPFVPIVRVPNVDAGIAAALKAEHGYRHTALIHSRNIENVTKMARAMNTTLFVSNAPCSAALGSGGPGYLSFSIATPTGEGVTTPLTFTRERQVTLGAGAMRVV